jgi:multidrug resistance efflux pump
MKHEEIVAADERPPGSRLSGNEQFASATMEQREPLLSEKANEPTPPPPRRLHSRRQRIIAVLLAVAVAIGVAGVAHRLLAAADDTYAAAVQPRQLAELNFQNPAPLAAILVKPGQRVRKGQVLARQQVGSLQALVAADKAALEADRARLTALQHPTLSEAQAKQLQLQLQRAQQEAQAAARSPNATRETLAAAQTAIEMAENAQAVARTGTTANQVEAAQAQLARDQTQLASDQRALAALTVIAPFDGIVASVRGTPGELVGVTRAAPPSATNVPTAPGFTLFPPPPQRQNTAGSATSYTPVVTVVGNSGWQVVAQVPEAAIARVRPGQRAKVHVHALSSAKLTATVEQVEGTPVNTGNTVSYDVTLTLDQSSVPRLLTGMTANVEISSS